MQSVDYMSDARVSSFLDSVSSFKTWAISEGKKGDER